MEHESNRGYHIISIIAPISLGIQGYFVFFPVIRYLAAKANR
jgi:hypothetical protein